MYRLYLMRHAEASRAKPGGADADRPLTDRGRRAAAALGRRMQSEDLHPAFVFCSSARRTRETWEAVASGLSGPAPEALVMPELYRGDAADYRILIATAPTEESVLVIGHNPALEELARLLTGGGDTVALEAMTSGFPAGGLAVLDFTDPWWRIAPGAGRLAAFLAPAE